MILWQSQDCSCDNTVFCLHLYLWRLVLMVLCLGVSALKVSWKRSSKIYPASVMSSWRRSPRLQGNWLFSSNNLVTSLARTPWDIDRAHKEEWERYGREGNVEKDRIRSSGYWQEYTGWITWGWNEDWISAIEQGIRDEAQSECVCFDSRILIKVSMLGWWEWRGS